MTAPPVWVVELAERFWSAAGPPPPFPRDLTRAVTDAAPLGIVARPNLSFHTVTGYLSQSGLPVPVRELDRPLRAALYCWRGSGFVFLDSADPPAEQRFSLAHELAHFLRDCDDLRRRLVRALGPAALEVLDGLRPATADERIAAVLRTLSLGPHVHLMSRDAAGRPAGAAERDAEDRADRLAFELLAPASELVGETTVAALAARLESALGLPADAAQTYADQLLPADPHDPLLARIRKSC